MEEKKILIIAGEPSADLHGSKLVKALREEKNISFFGVGGENLKKEGFKTLVDIEKISVVGIFEVFFKLPYFYLILNKILKKVDEENPKLAILMDYPGFNFVLMKKLWQRKIPVVYYICPQLWAWKPERIRALKKYTVKCLVIFPFEEEFYKRNNLEAIYVGNPLLDIIEKEEVNFQRNKIGIFPGSRKREIKYLLPPFLEISKYLNDKIKNIQFYIKSYPSFKNYINEKIKKMNFKIIEIEETPKDLGFSLMASGTVTLENGLYGIPGFVFYRLNPLTYYFMKDKVKTKFISIANILLDEMVYPEFIQRKVLSEKVKEMVYNFIMKEEKIMEIKGKLKRLWEILGHGAVKKAKEEILKLI